MNRKYRSLRIISALHKVIGLLILVLGVLSGIVQMVTTPPYRSFLGETSYPGVGIGVMTIISAVITGILLLAVGELIELLVNAATDLSRIAENTAQTADYLHIRRYNKNKAASQLGRHLPPSSSPYR